MDNARHVMIHPTPLAGGNRLSDDDIITMLTICRRAGDAKNLIDRNTVYSIAGCLAVGTTFFVLFNNLMFGMITCVKPLKRLSD